MTDTEKLYQERLKRYVTANYNQKPDRVPLLQLANSYAMINAGYTLTDLHTAPKKVLDAWRWTCEQYGWESEPHYTHEAVSGSWDFGAKMKMPDSPYAMTVSVESFPVKTEADVMNLTLPDPKTSGAIPVRMEYAELQSKTGGLVTFRTRSPFNTAADICGVEQFCRWLIKKPELCVRLIDLSMTHIFNALQYWVGTFGADRIFCCVGAPSESNQVISPKHFREYALPYHLEFHKRVRALGIKRFMFHICG